MTVKQHWEREARKAGVRSRDLHDMRKQVRGHHNMMADRVHALQKDARAAYQATTKKPLNRRHPAFNGGDWAAIPGFDAVARSVLKAILICWGRMGTRARADMTTILQQASVFSICWQRESLNG